MAGEQTSSVNRSFLIFIYQWMIFEYKINPEINFYSAVVF